MVNLGEAYRKLIGKTNKRRTNDEERTNKRRTNDEQMTVRAARADKQMTNNERTMNEQ